MLTRIIVVLFCLAGIQTLCRATDPVFEAGEKSKSDTVRLTETQTLQFGPFSMQGKDLSVRVKSPDQKIITLKGNAQLVCGQTRISADQIEVSYKDQQDLRMRLEGNIEIENERDQLRMFARKAFLSATAYGRSVVLLTRDLKHVTLVRTSDDQTTEIQASQIQLLFSDSHTLKIVAIEKAKIKKRPARSTDLVRIESSAPSELDFFDGISITDCQISTKEDPRKRRQRGTEVEKLQLLK